MLKKLLKHAYSLLPADIQGHLDFYLRPGLREGFSGPLNGQKKRQQLFHAVVESIQPEQIVETGTFRGTTTEYFASFGLPIHSVEVNERYFVFSQKRFQENPQVHLYCGDTTDHLNALLRPPNALRGNTIYYLDAHWEEHLPLAEEISIILKHPEPHVIMIDDFQVPDDEGYQFDDYGPGKCVSLDYLKENISGTYSLYVFFPTATSAEETGHKRGVVILTSHEQIASQLASLPQLRQYESLKIN